MSIYGTWLLLSAVEQASVDGPPVVYPGSHLIPDPTVRAGFVEVGVIPNHVIAHAQGVPMGAPEHVLAGYAAQVLRLGVGTRDTGEPYNDSDLDRRSGAHATVVLDRAQVQALRDTLTAWLDADSAGLT